MDEILAACPAVKPPPPAEPVEPSMGQKLEHAVAELNRLQKHQAKLAKQLKRATEYRNHVLHKISENVADLAEAKRIVREAKAEVGGDCVGAAEQAKKNDDAEEDIPALSEEELAMLDDKQKDEHAKIQAEFQQSKQHLTAKKEAVQNAKKAIEAAKRIQTTAKACKRRKGDDGNLVDKKDPASEPAGVAAAEDGTATPADPEVQLASQFDLTNDEQIQPYLAQLARIKGRAKKTAWIDDEMNYITERVSVQAGDQNYSEHFDETKPTVKIFVANCTQYNEAAKKLMEDVRVREYDLVACNEHHLRGPAAEIEASRLMQDGWRSHGTWTPARQSPRSTNGTLGGACILRRRHRDTRIHLPDAQGHSIYAKEFYDTSVIMWRLKGQHIAFITVYLTASIGFAGENIRKMKHLMQITRSLGNTPWIACGDFTYAPQEFEATPWLTLLGGMIA
ncbi:unnamed protein product, partial [Prorocentrum cordatum]